MKDSKDILAYIKHMREVVEQGPSPDTVFVPKGECKRLAEKLGLEFINPDILRVLNDESIDDLTILEIHTGDVCQNEQNKN